jgi:peptidyl-prolyl cis-trans isomerase SurA
MGRGLILLGLWFALLPAGRGADSRLANAIAVIVNDRVITYADIQKVIAPQIETLRRLYGRDAKVLGEKITALEQEKIQMLVERELILHDFKTSGFNLPESFIDDAVEERIRSEFGSRLTLTKTLHEQGTNFEQWRQDLRDEIIIGSMWRRNVSSEVIISPQKIQDHYTEHKQDYRLEDQVKLRMIVVNKNGANDGRIRQLVEEIRAKVLAGAAFAEMASVYSDGSQRREGGDWGWVDRKTLRAELATVAFELKPGQLSEVIDTPEACYLMLVEDVRPTHYRPLSDVQADIERTLVAQERARLQKKYVDKLKAKSLVRYF